MVLVKSIFYLVVMIECLLSHSIVVLTEKTFPCKHSISGLLRVCFCFLKPLLSPSEKDVGKMEKLLNSKANKMKL